MEAVGIGGIQEIRQYNIISKHPGIELTGIGGRPTKIETEWDLLGYSVVYYHPDKIETNTLPALCSIFLQ